MSCILMHIVYTQTKRRTRRLNWVCTSCQLPIYGTLGINDNNDEKKKKKKKKKKRNQGRGHRGQKLDGVHVICLRFNLVIVSI